MSWFYAMSISVVTDWNDPMSVSWFCAMSISVVTDWNDPMSMSWFCAMSISVVTDWYCLPDYSCLPNLGQAQLMLLYIFYKLQKTWGLYRFCFSSLLFFIPHQLNDS